MMDKFKKMRKKALSGKLEKHLFKKAAPAFLAIDGRYYITDRHHTSRAALEVYKQGLSSIAAFPLIINESYRALPMTDFTNKMNKRGLLYLYLRGERQEPSSLPRTLSELEDDPYRSLSWLMREEGCFEKVDTPYLEFIWADFLRSKIELKSGSETDLLGVLQNAMELCDSQEASRLPGFRK